MNCITYLIWYHLQPVLFDGKYLSNLFFTVTYSTAYEYFFSKFLLATSVTIVIPANCELLFLLNQFQLRPLFQVFLTRSVSSAGLLVSHLDSGDISKLNCFFQWYCSPKRLCRRGTSFAGNWRRCELSKQQWKNGLDDGLLLRFITCVIIYPKLVSTRPYFTVRPTNLLPEGPVNNLQDGQFITYSTGVALGQ